MEEQPTAGRSGAGSLGAAAVDAQVVKTESSTEKEAEIPITVRVRYSNGSSDSNAEALEPLVCDYLVPWGGTLDDLRALLESEEIIPEVDYDSATGAPSFKVQLRQMLTAGNGAEQPPMRIIDPAELSFTTPGAVYEVLVVYADSTNGEDAAASSTSTDTSAVAKPLSSQPNSTATSAIETRLSNQRSNDVAAGGNTTNSSTAATVVPPQASHPVSSPAFPFPNLLSSALGRPGVSGARPGQFERFPFGRGFDLMSENSDEPNFSDFTFLSDMLRESQGSNRGLAADPSRPDRGRLFSSDPSSLLRGMAMGQNNDPTTAMRDLLNSPIVRSLTSDPTMLRAMMDANPQMRELRERNPELNAVLSDPELLRQSMEAIRNPSLMREMASSTDRALSNIEAIPGGFNSLRQMYHSIQEPMWEAALNGGRSGKNGQRSEAVNASRYVVDSDGPPSVEAVPNPWARPPPVGRVSQPVASRTASSTTSRSQPTVTTAASRQRQPTSHVLNPPLLGRNSNSRLKSRRGSNATAACSSAVHDRVERRRGLPANSSEDRKPNSISSNRPVGGATSSEDSSVRQSDSAAAQSSGGEDIRGNTVNNAAVLDDSKAQSPRPSGDEAKAESSVKETTTDGFENASED